MEADVALKPVYTFQHDGAFLDVQVTCSIGTNAPPPPPVVWGNLDG